jgi:DNA-binding NtrC family response regulator
LTVLSDADVDLVIQDMNFEHNATTGEDGIALFHRIRREHRHVPIILMTAWTHLETAVELVKAGAADYIAKPWDDARLITTASNLLQLRAALTEADGLRRGRIEAREELAAKYELRGVIYDSEAMHMVIATAAQVAQSDVPVLITGPSGVGKEVIAEIVQANSACRAGPFVKVNVGALPNELMESELFGVSAGAYTGARPHAGRFATADGGTLFLDEMGNLPLPSQAKLLRVLQTGEFEPLGSSITRRATVRVISATNQDLRAAIAEGRFREDLYYRLNVIELRVPALAARREDILPLARHFLKPGAQLTAAAERALLNYSWPGNVRELKNCMQRAGLLSSTELIGVAALDLPSANPVGDDGYPHLERSTIERALTRADGVIASAARDLGVSRQALYRLTEKHGLKASPARNG